MFTRFSMVLVLQLVLVSFGTVHARVSDERLLAAATAAGAPAATVRRALIEMNDSVYTNKAAVGIFDLSLHSKLRRFFLIDTASGRVESFHASHGTGNGPGGKANRFRGFNDPDRNMTPLGPLVTDRRSGKVPGYNEVRDPVSGRRHSGLLVLGLEGTKPYNLGINDKGAWVVFHSKNYATEGYRRRNGGAMGRSHGCIVLDPTVVNHVIGKLIGGALVYVAVGNEPVENYSQKR